MKFLRLLLIMASYEYSIIYGVFTYERDVPFPRVYGQQNFS